MATQNRNDNNSSEDIFQHNSEITLKRHGGISQIKNWQQKETNRDKYKGRYKSHEQPPTKEHV